jgi:hypothetical protein
MTNEDRIRNLRTFGYTDREAQFLLQAALHSGYFLRRQYCAVINRKLGKTIDNFIAKLREEKHVKDIDLRYRRKVYSLCSKVLFEALGEPDNRNRRQHDAQTIKARLMGFDYVLGESEARWFPTEKDKLTLFGNDLGIRKEHLPVWRYSSKDGKQTTFRWFVDKPLVFQTGSDETVRFGFVDPGFRTAEPFASFLRNYRPLFSRLDRFEVVYVAGFEGAIEPARRLFDSLISPERRTPEDPITGDILTYFIDRKEHAINGLAAFDQHRLDRYREARRQFAATRFDELFEVWKQRGDDAIRAAISPESRPDLHARGAFAAHVLNFNFGLFGSLYEAGRGD